MLKKNPLFNSLSVKRSATLLFVCLSLSACGQQIQPSAPSPQVKNVILMIGDGMGFGQINSARWTARQSDQTLHMDSLPVTGLVNTHSIKRLVTDSAAAATAMATGHKTGNKMIGVTLDGQPLKNIFEAAKEKGLATGLVATSSITHATPAAFVSHVNSRKQQEKIALQLLASNTDLFLGGGEGFFLPSSEKNSLRNDQHDLIAEAKSKGYEVIKNKTELLSSRSNKILGLFAKDGLNDDKHEPSLAEMTQIALEKLSANSKGFILMIEGSQIDWAAHYNETENTIRHTLAFDQAVGVAKAFAKNKGDTLLLVTADHETGGMTLDKGKLNGHNLEISWSSKHHTATDVPIFAFGPGAMKFTGTFDNTQIPRRIDQLLDLPDFPD